MLVSEIPMPGSLIMLVGRRVNNSVLLKNREVITQKTGDNGVHLCVCRKAQEIIVVSQQASSDESIIYLAQVFFAPDFIGLLGVDGINASSRFIELTFRQNARQNGEAIDRDFLGI